MWLFHLLCPFESQGAAVCSQEDTVATGLLGCCLPLHCWPSRTNFTHVRGASGGHTAAEDLCLLPLLLARQYGLEKACGREPGHPTSSGPRLLHL